MAGRICRTRCAQCRRLFVKTDGGGWVKLVHSGAKWIDKPLCCSVDCALLWLKAVKRSQRCEKKTPR